MRIGSIDVSEDSLRDFCRRNRIHELSLFGSAQRKDFRPDSDVDLLVEFESDARVGLIAFSRMQRELSAIIGRKVDLVPKDGLKPLIRASVLGSSRVLYAA
jgi:predicted nucleotidyltransferase